MFYKLWARNRESRFLAGILFHIPDVIQLLSCWTVSYRGEQYFLISALKYIVLTKAPLLKLSGT